MVLAQPLPGAGPDLERLHRARLGDSGALQELITSHRTLVEHEARRFVSDRDDIDDIAQETWIRAAQALGSLRDEARFRPWLRAIARNACLTFLSRRRPSDSLDDEDAIEPADREADGPEASAEQRDERRRVWEALGALTEIDRRALYLREVESLPFDEVARRLGVRKNAAEVRVHRARTRFRQLYEATDATQPACGMAGIRLALLLDGELHGETASAVESHLSSCAACTQRMRKMADGRSLYRRMGMFALPGMTGLLERFQRVADAVVRWFPLESAPLITGSGNAPVTAASSVATAVVAAVALVMPSLIDVREAVAEHVPLPGPVTALLGDTSDAPSLTTASAFSAPSPMVPGAAPGPVPAPAVSTRSGSPITTLGSGSGDEAIPASGQAPATEPVVPGLAPSQPMSAAPALVADSPVPSPPNADAGTDTETNTDADTAVDDDDDDASMNSDGHSRGEDGDTNRGRDRDSNQHGRDEGRKSEGNTSTGGDDSDRKGGGHEAKGHEGLGSTVSIEKASDGGGRGNASPALTGDGERRGGAPAPRSDDGGGGRRNEPVARSDHASDRTDAAMPKHDDGNGRGGGATPKNDNDGGRDATPSSKAGHDDSRSEVAAARGGGSNHNPNSGKGGGNGKH